MDSKKMLRLIAMASSLSFIMAGSIVAAYFLGMFFVRYAGWDKITVVLFIVLGIVAGFYNVYRFVGKD